jgi:hypothetical protein
VAITLIDVGSTQQIVESADPVPSVTIAFQHNAVLAGFDKKESRSTAIFDVRGLMFDLKQVRQNHEGDSGA